uniref:DNA-directed RNA polymerase n=1 Tax=Oogamochlamys gigantea TaxID=158507 RepID=A0A0S2LNB0_9CHLO|nr:beta subunit of RNA polymerase [Oogamochlamys gigantea]ALO62809.1 beta subunit of RNA polymerase [Oogamochlamys gigantea]
MPLPRYLLSDFVEIQRKSFFELLEKGLIEEFTKRNPITDSKKNLEIFFYPEYYRLTLPENSPRNAILKTKSYTSKFYIPVQLTDKTSKIINLKWVCIGNLPLMTKRGHFILNGAPRVVINQILRSPGIYYQKKVYEKFRTKWSYKPETSYKRYYADLICQRGTWLRLEMDKDKCLWAQMKKGPKIPLFWFLIGMGLTEKIIFDTISEPTRLLANIENFDEEKMNEEIYNYVKNPPEAWYEIFSLVKPSVKTNGAYQKLLTRVLGTNVVVLDPSGLPKTNKINAFQIKTSAMRTDLGEDKALQSKAIEPSLTSKKSQQFNPKCICIGDPLRASRAVLRESLVKRLPDQKWRNSPIQHKNTINQIEQNVKGASIWIIKQNSLLKTREKQTNKTNKKDSASLVNLQKYQVLQELGRRWLFNKFMNSRTYDLGKLGRFNFNKKLGLSIAPTNCTLTPQDLLYATDYLIKVEQGVKKIDDIDHLKNRRVRTSGELVQIQIGTGLIRLEKEIREKLNGISLLSNPGPKSLSCKARDMQDKRRGSKSKFNKIYKNRNSVSVNQFINTKALNSSLREFFGSSPLSQFMDQINPLSELTHKRRLSSMGPGGVTRDSATLAIRGIHPTHYGRICPIETPEGKNTGLVNSLTTFARVNAQGFLQSPFYKVYKGQVQKKSGMFYLSADQEERIKLAAADLSISPAGFLPQSNIPVRVAEDFTKIQRTNVEYIGISANQMISIATSLIPFLEHDDANRALMGSNMQRQAVPLIRSERPIVGTGLEARAVSDSGHILQAKYSGYVRYVSGNKIIIYSFN